jgi:hypothetical protein
VKTYIPFFRGKQNELMAVRDLAELIAARGNVIPIIEPVKANATTRISLDKYVEVSMPFMFVCNPGYGDFAGQNDRLFSEITTEILMEYDNWIPSLRVRQESLSNELSSFMSRYDGYPLAVIYQGLPSDRVAMGLLANESITRHAFLSGKVPSSYINNIGLSQRIMISDPFNRVDRNADYPPREFFTDMNTLAGNPSRIDFGDFSVVGDHYAETGGPAYAIALHHIHFQTNSGALEISHFISDRTDTTVDPGGKTIEALNKLVAALDELNPNNTEACKEYRDIADAQIFRGLGYMKRLAIKHHLEVMLDGGIQL